MVTRGLLRVPATVTAGVFLAVAACQASDAEESGPVATPAPPAAVLAAQTCAAATLTPMSRQQRVGQLLVVGVDADDPARAAPWVAKYHLGGVLLTGSTPTTVDDGQEGDRCVARSVR